MTPDEILDYDPREVHSRFAQAERKRSPIPVLVAGIVALVCGMLSLTYLYATAKATSDHRYEIGKKDREELRRELEIVKQDYQSRGIPFPAEAIPTTPTTVPKPATTTPTTGRAPLGSSAVTPTAVPRTTAVTAPAPAAQPNAPPTTAQPTPPPSTTTTTTTTCVVPVTLLGGACIGGVHR